MRDGGNGYLEEMLSVVQAARVVTGSILIIAGLIAIPLPLTPGLPLIIIGLAFGFSWHPKGLYPDAPNYYPDPSQNNAQS